MKSLDKIRRALLCFLPVSLFFSYYPVISFGSNDSMNFELSLPLITLLIFATISLPSLFLTLKTDKKRTLRRLIPLLFPLYLTISVLWSANPLRGALTSGIVWCLVISILTIPELISSQKIKRKIVNIYLLAALLVCVFCWIQSILSVLGFSNSAALLCQGCGATTFGFPHPNGFALEPQFMGSLLLAPAILSLFLLCYNPGFIILRFRTTAFIIITLFLTFSRGAIFAFLLAVFLIIIYEIIKKRPKHLFSVGIAVVPALVLAIFAQGVMAALGPTSDTLETGIAKSLNHLSLGLIDEREKYAPLETGVESSFDGYVAESTEIRADLSKKALDIWDDSPENLLFGVGVGASGEELYKKFPELGSPKEIVQNEYLEILLETGVVGAVLCLLMVVCGLKAILGPKGKFGVKNFYLLALIAAYAFSLCFFSGLPNALHIYLLPAIAKNL